MDLIASFLVLSQLTIILAHNDVCIDTARHKAAPTPEPDLKTKCSIWQSKSCCTSKTAENIESFSIGQYSKYLCQNKPLSDKCKEFFIKEACLFECSPSLGPFIVKKPEHSILRDNIQHAPLCFNDCSNWFEACASDYTCSRDWTRNVPKSAHGRGSYCPEDKCSTFNETFLSAKSFCQELWHEAYMVTEDEENCMGFGPLDPSKDLHPIVSSSTTFQPVTVFLLGSFIILVHKNRFVCHLVNLPH